MFIYDMLLRTRTTVTPQSFQVNVAIESFLLVTRESFRDKRKLSLVASGIATAKLAFIASAFPWLFPIVSLETIGALFLAIL